jgi:hypothetical protein
MRYSPDAPIDPEIPIAETEDNRAFFERIGALGDPSRLAGALLLVGGTDHRSLALRRAQSLLRYDRRPSVWSHAALLLEWVGGDAGAIGLEVTLDPEGEHLPERNGVSVFHLSRYYDTGRYPNIALVAPSFAPPASGNSDKSTGLKAIVEAALDPNRERSRFPLWDALGAWSRYTYTPETAQNPLLSNVPIPGAAFCEYAYAMAGVDLTPGATSDQTCPELLWATVKRWSTRLAEMQGTKLEAFAMRRDLSGLAPPGAPDLSSDPALKGLFSARRAATKRATKTPSKRAKATRPKR